MASAAVVRLSADQWKVAGARTGSAGGSAQTAASSATASAARSRCRCRPCSQAPARSYRRSPSAARSLPDIAAPRRRSQHGDVACAIGERAQPDIDACGRHVMQLDRDHPRRQALAAPAQPMDHFRTGRVVEQQAGVAPARLAIGRKRGSNPRAQFGHRRIGIAQGAGRADGRAGAATHAKVRLDRDVITVGADRGRRANVDA